MPGEPPQREPVEPWLAGGGDAGELVRSLDWSSTPLGPIASWPPSLKTTVGALLHSRHPMFLWWGRELIQIYNDGYVPSFGKGKHPRAMGQRGRECWQEIWPIIGPQIEDVMMRAKASWAEDQLVPVWSNARIDEAYWTYGYSPVFDESGAVGGTLVVCNETTSRVLAVRRLGAMQSLAKGIAPATSAEAVMDAAERLFGESTGDIPFALIYSTDAATGNPLLSRSVGLDDATRVAVNRALRTKLVSVAGETIALGNEAPALILPGGPWPETSTSAFVAPLAAGPLARPSGFVVFGLSPRLTFDGAYRVHLQQLAEHVGMALARIETYRAREATSRERDNLLLKAPVATALFRGPDHVFELANERFLRMVNRSSDVVGRPYREGFPEVVGTPLAATLDHVYRTGEPFSTGEMLVRLDRQGDGTLQEGFFTFNIEPLRDEKGRVYGMMAVAVEITEQVNARRSVERTQKEREGLLHELEAANRAKDEFLAMLGHELRNPLSPIVTALSLMKRRSDGRTTREQDIIERQVGHLVRLVDDLLDVSKITRGKITLRREPVEMADVVAKAMEMSGDLLEQRRHRLTIDVPPRGLLVDGDPVRLAQVVANLLTNAARYTEPGGVVSVRAVRDARDAVLVVKDTGVGIAPEMLPHIFDLFVQGQQSADRKEGGLGLGLALVRSLVALHGGTVVARSEGAGKGSEFEIRLPAAARIAEGDVARPPTVPGSAKRVLVVDDNVDSAEMLGELLREAGHDVAVAHDGPAALGIVEGFAPDVALLDIGLPVMDGYELGKRVHEFPNGSRCRLIALTGYGHEHDRDQSKASGFEAHLVKPVDPDRVLGVVGGGERMRNDG